MNDLIQSEALQVAHQSQLLVMLDPTRPGESERFTADIDVMMRHTEGTSLALMTYLYSFDYLRVSGSEIHTQGQAIDAWKTNIYDGVNSLMSSVNAVTTFIEKNQDSIRVKKWTSERVSSL